MKTDKDKERGSIKRGNRTVSGSFTIKLAGDFAAQLFDSILPYCPLCLFTHPSALWIRCEPVKSCTHGAQHCANCGATVLRVYSTK